MKPSKWDIAAIILLLIFFAALIGDVVIRAKMGGLQ